MTAGESLVLKLVVTLALIGAGLLGLIGFAVLRRRRKTFV